MTNASPKSSWRWCVLFDILWRICPISWGAWGSMMIPSIFPRSLTFKRRNEKTLSSQITKDSVEFVSPSQASIGTTCRLLWSWNAVDAWQEALDNPQMTIHRAFVPGETRSNIRRKSFNPCLTVRLSFSLASLRKVDCFGVSWSIFEVVESGSDMPPVIISNVEVVFSIDPPTPCTRLATASYRLSWEDHNNMSNPQYARSGQVLSTINPSRNRKRTTLTSSVPCSLSGGTSTSRVLRPDLASACFRLLISAGKGGRFTFSASTMVKIPRPVVSKWLCMPSALFLLLLWKWFQAL